MLCWILGGALSWSYKWAREAHFLERRLSRLNLTQFGCNLLFLVIVSLIRLFGARKVHLFVHSLRSFLCCISFFPSFWFSRYAHDLFISNLCLGLYCSFLLMQWVLHLFKEKDPLYEHVCKPFSNIDLSNSQPFCVLIVLVLRGLHSPLHHVNAIFFFLTQMKWNFIARRRNKLPAIGGLEGTNDDNTTGEGP